VGGLLLGFAGVALLVGSLEDLGGNGVGLAGGVVVVFGALVAFTCYIWLLKMTTPARVSTYA